MPTTGQSRPQCKRPLGRGSGCAGEQVVRVPRCRVRAGTEPARRPARSARLSGRPGGLGRGVAPVGWPRSERSAQAAVSGAPG